MKAIFFFLPLLLSFFFVNQHSYSQENKSKLVESLHESLQILNEQENQMNIEFLEKFVKHFDKQYSEAYNSPF
jgi:hypothetical protein